MRLIANKPCSFGGRKFYIGDEIPEYFVADAGLQEKMRVITIVREGMGEPDCPPDSLFTQQGEERNDGVIQISVKGESDGQYTEIPANPAEIQKVFAIMQMNAEEGAKAIAEVTSETVLILLHAADSRKTVKNAAKEQADKLFQAGNESNESGKDNETTGTTTEGDDA